MRDFELPWFPRALQVLDLRRKDRLLLVEPGGAAAARAAAQLIGAQGSLTVLEPNRHRAEAIAAALPAADVLALAIEGGERFGAFDAVLATPFAGPLGTVADWAALLQHNLRPGGRFVLDLPAPDLLPDVRTAAAAVSPACSDRLVAALSGPPTDQLVAALAATQLRRCETLLGTHLLQLPSPLDLVELVAEFTPLDEDERFALADALVRTLRATNNVETLAHRTSVAGMR